MHRNAWCWLIGLTMLLSLQACAAKSQRASIQPPIAPSSSQQSKSVNWLALAAEGRVSHIQWSDDGTSVRFVSNNKPMRFGLERRTLEEIKVEDGDDDGASSRSASSSSSPHGRFRLARGQQHDRATSPDGKWVAICRDWNVILEPLGDDEQDVDWEPEEGSESNHSPRKPINVTTGGHRKFRYGKASWVYGEELRQTEAMWWSPDSTKLVFYEFDERNVPDHYLVAGLTDRHTRVLTEGYPKAGEPNPVVGLLIYDLISRTTIRVDTGDDPDWYVYNVRFSPTGSDLLLNRTNRRQNVLQVVAVDPTNGTSRVVLTETQETWQENSPEMHFLRDGRRFIWATERSGWRHYELRDLDGTLHHSLTQGDYPVASIERVDEDTNLLYYTAYSDPANPLHVHLHRVNLDGSNPVRLTSGPLSHRVDISPCGGWFIAECESLDAPPETVLYDSRGERIATLAACRSAQWDAFAAVKPELFTFKADDGVTDIYGVLYKPADFDPSRKYPLVIDVYGGPFSQGVRARFSPTHPGCAHGFLVAKIDNRGTRHRGKAFEAAAYMKLGEVDLKDQVDGVRYLAQRPYVDADRVGIYGHSYGGYMAALAILKYPDVFHVAVAGAPVTDWRNYDSIYTERFMRMPEENPEGYDAGSCLTYAGQLKGKLLLLHGMLDDNVHPSNTFQLMDALQKAGKPFDVMLYPNAGHGLGVGATTLRWQYLKQHLLPERQAAVN